MSRSLRPQPSLEHLKNQAKALLRDFQQGEPEAVERFRSLRPLGPNAPPRLSDAQHLIAREYGFASWPKLKAYVETARVETGDPIEAFKWPE